MKLFGTICACCLAVVGLQRVAAAQNYTFTNIVDTSGPFAGFGFPKLNNSGAISFQANLDGGDRGVYRSDGVDITTIADNTGPNGLFNNHTDINDSGQVAFIGTSQFGKGIFRGDGLTMTKIADESTSLMFDVLRTRPSINNAGQVAFFASDDNTGGLDFIVVGSGGNLTTFADTYGPLGEFSAPSIDNLGRVAFSGRTDGGVSGIFRSNGGTISTIIDDSGPYSEFISSVGFNDNAVVAAFATLDAGGAAIIRVDGSTVDVIAGSPDVELNSNYVGLNNSGEVAFVVALSPTMNAILTGPDPVADKVIAEGDSLFGSTIQPNYFNNSIDGPNDAGQIVFSYHLTDGRFGIALATPLVELLCPGDYNGNDEIDAADYTVWRDAFTAGSSVLLNDPTPGTVDESDFLYWRNNFGDVLGSGNSAAAIPEPGSMMLLCLAALGVAALRRWPRKR